eukprot:scaffold307_cov146-Skeletonema_menzelii.AAC.8
MATLDFTTKPLALDVQEEVAITYINLALSSPTFCHPTAEAQSSRHLQDTMTMSSLEDMYYNKY